ncbi:zinc-finger domain-containing protein [Paenibacillus sp. 7028]|nr:zinc-finger domain-containing protein [Paenibacillus apii]
MHGTTNSQVDGLCINECPVGGLLQLYGKQLIRERK